MPGITNRSRKTKKTVGTMTLSESMANCHSAIIKGMIVLAATAILTYAGMGMAIIITVVLLAG